MTQRESTFIRDTRTHGGMFTTDWAIALKSSKLEVLAREAARRDGYDPESESVLEAYEEAIKDCLFDAVDELLFQLRLYAERGKTNDFAEQVRERADELLREWTWGRAGTHQEPARQEVRA